MWPFSPSFARTRMAVAQSLDKASEQYDAPEPAGRQAWLQNSGTVDQAWSTLASPVWAIHLAFHVGRSVRRIMDAGTAAVAGSIEGYESELPGIPDTSVAFAKLRAVPEYFDWSNQGSEDLLEGMVRYENAAREHLAVLRTTQNDEAVSPYRGTVEQASDAVPKLHMLQGVMYWFTAAAHASDISPRKGPMCETLAVSLGHAFAARPSRRAELLALLVQALR